jgi:ATPase subunit of ABC transporter with duplicated ATPase domains
MDSLDMSHLQGYLGGVGVPAFVMISHDRDLLDGVTDRTLWLRDQRCYGFTLPYSQARTALAAQDEANQKAREEEEKEIAQLKVSAKRLATWGKVYDNKKLARKAKTMEKRVGKLEECVTFVSKGSGLSLEVDAELTKSKQLFAIDHEQVCTPDNTPLFSIEELVFRPGDRVALLGINGVGKSSFIKALLRHFNQELDAQTSVRFNPNVKIGYFDQELAHFDSPLGISDWVTSQCTTQEEFAKRALISWGFPYSDHQRPVKVLSGGERARLLLLTFQLEQPNLLIMDEPTNHIDLQGKEELEHDLAKSGISLLFTSHDRRFIESTATRYWWIRDGMLTEIHDPQPYFESMQATAGLHSSSPGAATTAPLADVIELLDEDRLLERICELEELISQDKARKPKFQKPAKQETWQKELTLLTDQLSTIN